jgi:hypothetical protein
MKIEPGTVFLVKGVSYTAVRKSFTPQIWLIRQTYNPVANLIFKDEEWIKSHASNRRKVSKHDEDEGN